MKAICNVADCHILAGTSFVLGKELICPILDVLFPLRRLLLALGDSCQSNRGPPHLRVSQREYWTRISGDVCHQNEAAAINWLGTKNLNCWEVVVTRYCHESENVSSTALSNLIKQMAATSMSVDQVTTDILTEIPNVRFVSWCIVGLLLKLIAAVIRIATIDPAQIKHNKLRLAKLRPSVFFFFCYFKKKKKEKKTGQ